MIRFSGNITNTEISNNLFVTDSEIDDVMLWYKHWGEIWPNTTVLKDNIFLAMMMLYQNEVDGLVAGAVNTTANTVRPALQIIKT